MKRITTLLAALLGGLLALPAQTSAPAPVPPLPSENQVRWQQMETYAFIHFGLNTFNDREWGYGDAPLEIFNPSRLDCDQWARTVKAAGMKGIILTAKHHDGFCLWPTKYTDYSIRNTPYKEGKGDIVGELAEACRKHGLKLGLYLSPWDRHQAFYGSPFYVEYFYAQLQELLTQYGELFEVWFDGANGGDGWYGGAKETRTIDRRTYYDFPRAWKMIAELQPKAVIFSDGGPGCRWVGNEKGYAFATNWSLLRGNEVYPGYDKHWELQQGHADGDAWVPAECNVSIRPGWFYHEREDDKVKTVDQLVDLYYRSVGHNGTQLINFPVDKDGLIHPVDSARAVEAHRKVAAELRDNLLLKAKGKASDTRGKEFALSAVTDGDYDTYWATPDGVTEATLTFTFKRPVRMNRISLQEYIPLGQRVQRFTVEYLDGNQWRPISVGEETTTVGYRRLLRFKTINTKRIRVTFCEAKGPLCISEVGAFYAPNAKERYVERVDDVQSVDFSVVESGANDVLLDLGKPQTVRSFFYLPSQNARHEGMIANYELYAGDTPEQMQKVAEGEFSNIRNNPVMQEVYFTPSTARYLRLHATRMVRDGEAVKYARLAVR